MKLTSKKIGLLVLLAALSMLFVIRSVSQLWASSREEQHPAILDRFTHVQHHDYAHISFFTLDRNLRKHRVKSVTNYKSAFPDLNDVQLLAAQEWGVEPSIDRTEVELRKTELVFIGSNPYYHVDKLDRSIPFLVPRASALLNRLGRNFIDSLTVKQIPLHTFIVTSVLRTDDDVSKLRTHNVNASAQSCHRYGTTFDISYFRFREVGEDNDSIGAEVRLSKLKYVLAEVLDDARRHGLCYVKYEIKQGCFHITVR